MGVLEAADRGINVPEYATTKTKMVMEVHRDSISRAIAAGVKVAERHRQWSDAARAEPARSSGRW